MKDNIIQFPLNRTKISAESLDGPPETWHDKLSADLLQEILTIVYNDMEIEFDGEKLVYEVSLMYESINSFIMATNSQWHPMQDFGKDLYAKFANHVGNTYQLSFNFNQE